MKTTTGQITATNVREAMYNTEVVILTDGPHTLSFNPGFQTFHTRTNGKPVYRCNTNTPWPRACSTTP